MTQDLKTFNSRLQVYLAAIGRKNGLAPNPSQDEANAALHYLHVDTIAKSFFTAQHKRTLAHALTFTKESDIAKIVAETKKFNLGQTGTLITSQDYQLDLETKKGAAKVDVTVLTNELAKLGVDAEIIKKALDKATGQNEPAKSYIVSIIGE